MINELLKTKEAKETEVRELEVKIQTEYDKIFSDSVWVKNLIEKFNASKYFTWEEDGMVARAMLFPDDGPFKGEELDYLKNYLNETECIYIHSENKELHMRQTSIGDLVLSRDGSVFDTDGQNYVLVVKSGKILKNFLN